MFFRAAIFLTCLVFASNVAARDLEEMAAAKRILSELQRKSIVENREYCGVLLRRADGSLIASRSFRGNKAFCNVRDIPRQGKVVASFHTHGAYTPGYDNEVPSLIDLEVEMEWGIDGYVSTPGGRFWHVDGRAGRINLLCGPGCLPSDSRFQDQIISFGEVSVEYDIHSLTRRTNLGRARYKAKTGHQGHDHTHPHTHENRKLPQTVR